MRNAAKRAIANGRKRDHNLVLPRGQQRGAGSGRRRNRGWKSFVNAGGGDLQQGLSKSLRKGLGRCEEEGSEGVGLSGWDGVGGSFSSCV